MIAYNYRLRVEWMMVRSPRTPPRKYIAPATPDLTITIPGKLRYWVAEALIVRVRECEAAERPLGRRRKVPMLRRTSDELRDLYDQIV